MSEKQAVHIDRAWAGRIAARLRQEADQIEAGKYADSYTFFDNELVWQGPVRHAIKAVENRDEPQDLDEWGVFVPMERFKFSRVDVGAEYECAMAEKARIEAAKSEVDDGDVGDLEGDDDE